VGVELELFCRDADTGETSAANMAVNNDRARDAPSKTERIDASHPLSDAQVKQILAAIPGLGSLDGAPRMILVKHLESKSTSCLDYPK
tara:strand:- start:420 stop:683 length:264 start_codon:yes stop_codon:yes gene_type:complete